MPPLFESRAPLFLEWRGYLLIDRDRSVVIARTQPISRASFHAPFVDENTLERWHLGEDFFENACSFWLRRWQTERVADDACAAQP